MIWMLRRRAGDWMLTGYGRCAFYVVGGVLCVWDVFFLRGVVLLALVSGDSGGS